MNTYQRTQQHPKFIFKTIGWLLIIGWILIAGGRLIQKQLAGVEYQRVASSNWDLSERASTIAQKSEYMTTFESALESQKLSGYNSSFFFPTPSTDFNQNMKALHSLSKRLHDITGMDEQGFAYQTAIQQITAQEQGEAKSMLDCFESCWLRENHWTLWNPIVVILMVIIEAILCIGGVVCLAKGYDFP